MLLITRKSPFFTKTTSHPCYPISASPMNVVISSREALYSLLRSMLHSENGSQYGIFDINLPYPTTLWKHEIQYYSLRFFYKHWVFIKSIWIPAEMSRQFLYRTTTTVFFESRNPEHALQACKRKFCHLRRHRLWHAYFSKFVILPNTCYRRANESFVIWGDAGYGMPIYFSKCVHHGLWNNCRSSPANRHQMIMLV